MRVVVQKPDLDTCLAALILGVRESDDIVATPGEAPESDLNDPDVLCIEAGGSGLTESNNYDHHVADAYYPPACRQAYERLGKLDDRVARLVDYVCAVDERTQGIPAVEFPSLSNLFSGMLLVERGTREQFLRGIDMLKAILGLGIDPFGTMPDQEQWRAYRKAKEENHKDVQGALDTASFRYTRSGLRVGFVESAFVGGIGALYGVGCDIAIMCSREFGEAKVTKFTIAGNKQKVSHLLGSLNSLEAGWGGRETIIGSPRKGSALSAETVFSLVCDNS